MGRNIVICCDGTGNEVSADETNVLRLARMVGGRDDQIYYYDPGVGTQGAPTLDFASRQEILKILGMGIGLGLFDRVGNAYRFLMRVYQPGDRIYIFGFSRGSYVARALAGVVAKLGILEASRDNLVPYAVKLYSVAGNAPVAKPFTQAFSAYRPDIHFLGLWDTVKSVFYFDPVRPGFTSLSLPYTFDNAKVRTIRHAIALDERRRFFRTNLWTGKSAFTDDQDVKQVWFAGVHSDIGGGYPEPGSGLSKITLKWMIREAQAAGLHIDGDIYAQVLPDVSTGTTAAPDAKAELHVSLRGLWKILEWWPPFPRGARRFVPEGATIHQSVHDRMRDIPDYRPYLPATTGLET